MKINPVIQNYGLPKSGVKQPPLKEVMHPSGSSLSSSVHKVFMVAQDLSIVYYLSPIYIVRGRRIIIRPVLVVRLSLNSSFSESFSTPYSTVILSPPACLSVLSVSASWRVIHNWAAYPGYSLVFHRYIFTNVLTCTLDGVRPLLSSVPWFISLSL